MTHAEGRQFIRSHCEDFVNKKNLQIGNANFAADFVDHGADVPPGMPRGGDIIIIMLFEARGCGST